MAGITDKEVRALVLNAQREGKTRTQADGLIPGLTLTASKAGTASWVLRYRIGGKQKECTIGQFPTWGAADARAKAKELRQSADSGIDVAVEKQIAKQTTAQAWTVNDLWDSYFEKATKDGLAPHTLNQKRGRYERYIKPAIGNFPATSIKPENIVHTVLKCSAGGASIPRIVLIDLSQMFFHAVARAVCSSNPCRDVRAEAVTGKPPKPDEGIALSAQELAAFLPALKTIPRQYDLAIRLMLLTGVRVGVMTLATWGEFDFDAGVWAIPHEHRKNRKHTTGAFEIHLPAEAVEWLRELHYLAAGDARVLPVENRRASIEPHARGKRNVIGIWLDRLHANGEGWRRITPHDLRRTCRTALSELRIDEATAEKYLDHASGVLQAKYDKWQQCPERYAASEKLLQFLSRCEHGEEVGNVVSLYGNRTTA